MASDDEEELQLMRKKAKERQQASIGFSGSEVPCMEKLVERQERSKQMMRSMAEFFEEEPGKVKTNEENLNEAHDKEKEIPLQEKESNEDGNGLRAAFPTSFGKHIEIAVTNKSESVHTSTKRSEPFVGPPPPLPGPDLGTDTFIGPPIPEEGGYGSEGEMDDYKIPLSNEVVLKGHSKVVSALAIDPSGSRVLTGSYDYMVKMYDFQGMNAKLASFREFEPSEGHQVRALSFSPSGDLFLTVTGSAQAKIYDRDGFALGEFEKGDMYLRDLRHTKGHICGLTSGEWHPEERSTIMTASEDGSVRLWDIEDFKKHKQLVKPKLSRPGRISVTSCTWGPGGSTIAAGLADGSVQIWQTKGLGHGSLPSQYLKDAHESGEDVTAVLFSEDGKTLSSRSTDGTLKIWDLRKFKSPLLALDSLPCCYPSTGLAWGPDQKLLLTGTSTEKKGGKTGGEHGDGGGQVVFVDREKLEVVRKVGVGSSAVVRVAWHSKINQILASSGDRTTGGTHVLYSPTLSQRGALSAVSRAPRKSRPEDFSLSLAQPVIHNPHALPLFRDAPSRKRQREKARKDPLLSRKPELPVTGPGHGGRVGQSKGSLLTQYLLREGGLKKEIWRDEDPREAILKYAEVAEKDPKFIAPAYAETQPKPVFEESEEEEE